MSDFSEKCKELMAENETNVYRLSNSTSLERTTLQRMVTGKRLPNLDFVKQFCNALRMSASEREQLMELYKIEQIGMESYQKRKLIQSMLTMLSSTEHKQVSRLSESSPRFSPNFSDNLALQEYSTELILFFIMEEAFSSPDTSFIYTNLPASDETFFHQLQILFHRYMQNNVYIEHLFHFQIGFSAAIDNLNVLYRILPLALSQNAHYTAWYYYSKIQRHDFIQSLFPYYLITPTRVLEISGDFQTYILHNDPEKVRLYIEEFKKIKKISTPLLQYFDTPEKAYLHYAKQFPSSAQSIHVMEGQPCFFDMVNLPVWNEIKTTHPEFLPILQNLKDYHAQFENYEIHGFFTSSGLYSFLEDGILYGQVGAAFSPFSKKQQLTLLRNFLDRNPRHHRRMLKNSISFPKNIYFEIFKDKQMHIIQIDDQLNVSLFLIRESSICDSFYDFITSLEDAEFSLSETESDDHLKSLLKNSTR